MINYEALEFYDNGHLRICSICLRLAVSSLNGVQYLQIGPTGKRADTNENNMLKKFCPYGFVRWTKCIWCAIENIYLLVYKLFEIVAEGIPAIKNKTVIIFSSKYHLHCCNYWSENNNCILCICIWDIVDATSVCCSNYIVSSAWLYFLLEFTRERKS